MLYNQLELTSSSTENTVRRMLNLQVCVLLVLSSVIRISQSSLYSITPTERLNFGEVSTFLETESHVYHLAKDEYLPGNILFGDLHSIKTTDGTTTTIIAGSPRSSGYVNGVGIHVKFSVVTHFLQFTTNQVVLADNRNDCIRWLDRTNSSVTDFVGKCQQDGYSNGVGSAARFNSPTDVIRDKRDLNRVFISDRYNDAIRIIHIPSKTVSTLVKTSSLNSPRAFAYDPINSDSLIVTGSFRVSKISLSSLSLTTITGSSIPSFSDGTLNDARYSFCRQIVPVHDKVYVLIDYGNKRLRTVDTQNNKVTSICTGDADHLNGPISHCQLKNPSSLLLANGSLYIGTLTKIRVLPVVLEETEVTTTTTPTTTPATTKHTTVPAQTTLPTTTIVPAVTTLPTTTIVPAVTILPTTTTQVPAVTTSQTTSAVKTSTKQSAPANTTPLTTSVVKTSTKQRAPAGTTSFTTRATAVSRPTADAGTTVSITSAITKPEPFGKTDGAHRQITPKPTNSQAVLIISLSGISATVVIVMVVTIACVKVKKGKVGSNEEERNQNYVNLSKESNRMYSSLDGDRGSYLYGEEYEMPVTSQKQLQLAPDKQADHDYDYIDHIYSNPI